MNVAMNTKDNGHKINILLKTPSFIPCNNNNVVMIDAEKPMWLKTSITGKWLFEAINTSPLGVDELLQKAVEYYELPEEAIRQPVMEFLTQLEDAGFIQMQPEDNAAIPQQIENGREWNGCVNDDVSKQGVISVWLYVLSQCNLACPHCFLAEDTSSEPIPLDKAQYIIDNIALLKPKRLYISGGEPLLHPDLLKIVQYAKQRYEWQLFLETNGFTDTIDLIHKLSESVDFFHISLDGADAETHDSIRGIHSFEKAVYIFDFLDSVQSKAKRGISFTPQPGNVHQMPKLYNLAMRLKADAIYITKPKIPTRNNPDHQFIQEFLSFEFRRKVYEYYDQLVKVFIETRRKISLSNKLPTIEAQFDQSSSLLTPTKRACCEAGGSYLCINEKGECYPCDALMQKENLLGNVFDDPLQEIYEKKAVREFRQQIHVNHIQECQDCLYKYFCAGGCRALSGNVKNKSPYCELIKKRYEQLLGVTTVPK